MSENKPNRRTTLHFCLVRSLNAPVWVACACCTLLPRVLLPSAVEHPQNKHPCSHSLCTAWQHNYRHLSSSECVRSWTAFFWKTNQSLVKGNPRILIQSSPFPCLHGQSQAPRWALPSGISQVFHLKCEAQEGDKGKWNIPWEWLGCAKLFGLAAATCALNFLLFSIPFPSCSSQTWSMKGWCLVNNLF